MNSAVDLDIAIVGYGPTGAMLANLLGAYGWRVGIFDREPDLLNLPRAVHFDGEVMRVFQQAGLSAVMAPLARPSSGMQYFNVAGKLMLERKPATDKGEHGWANNYLFHQPDLERTLRQGIARFPNVHVFTCHEVEAVVQNEAAAQLTVRNLQDGSVREVRAKWVIGCDGARSLVQRAIGGGHTDLGLHQPWLVVDVELQRDIDLPTATVQFCDPARPMTFVNVTGLRRRWEIMLMPGDNPQAMTQPEVMWPLLARWIKPGDATLVRSAVYNFHSLIANRWRSGNSGRLLIAGDSAHQTPPFLGQGMCAGIRDAANLAWKLDLVLRGNDDALLDSYQSERQPHVQEFVATAVRLGNIIQTTDPEVAARRDLEFERGGPKEIVNLSPPLGPGLHAGGSCGDLSGGHIPGQPRLSDGRLLDEALGQGFAVVTMDETLAAPPATPASAHTTSADEKFDREIFRRLDTRWVCDPALAGWLSSLNAQTVVLRPDRYLFGAASCPADFTQLAAHLSSCLGPLPADLTTPAFSAAPAVT